MGPPRKPKIGLQRPSRKSAGKSQDNPKEEPKTTEGQKPIDLKTSDKPGTTFLTGTKTQEDKTLKLSDYTETQGTWQPVGSKNLRSDTLRKDIERIMPELEATIRTRHKSSTEKIPQWQNTKFRDLQKHLENTKPGDLKLRSVHTQMKAIAKFLGKMDLFDNSKKLFENKEPVSYTHLTLPTNREV